MRGSRPGRTALRADRAAGPEGERPVRPGGAAAGAVAERRRPSGHRQRAQQVGVEHQAGVVVAGRQRPEPPGQQQELLHGRLALGVGQPLGGLEHRSPCGVSAVVGGDRRAVATDRLGLGDDVERAAEVELDVDHHERLDPGAESRLGLANPFGHRPDPAVGPGEQGDDAVCLTQLLGAQHDRFVPVQAHASILPAGTDTAQVGAPSPAPPSSGQFPGNTPGVSPGN